MKKQDFFQCSVILIISAILSKFTGALFRIPLANMIGGTGMGYFSGAYGIFLPVYAVFVTGLSAASAKLTAESAVLYGSSGIKKVKKYSLISFLVTGIVGTAIILLFAKPFAVHIIGSDQAYISILIIAPSVLFSCITAAFRGCSEGQCNMYPTAVSQLIESVVKLCCGLLMCGIVIRNEAYFAELLKGVCTDKYALASAGAVAGVTLSSFAGMLYVVLCDILRKKQPAENGWLGNDDRNGNLLIRELAKTVVPIAVSALLSNLTSMVDLATIIRGLNASMAENAAYFEERYSFINEIGAENFAAFAYGSFNGLAVTVFNLVPSVTNIFGKSILPSVTGAWTKKDIPALEKNACTVLKVTALAAVPAGLGISLLSKEILSFLFPSSVNEVAIASDSLRFLGISVILLSVSFPLFSMLQAVGRADLPAKIMGVGVVVKFAGNLIFLRIPELNASGAALSTGICYAVILALSIISFSKCSNIKLDIFKIFSGSMYAGLLCIAAAWLAKSISARYLSNTFVLFISVFSGGIIYMLSLYLLGEHKYFMKGSFKNFEN